jgi:hypothetical protein
MANDTPGTIKMIYHLFTRDIFVGIHSNEIGNILLVPLLRWAPQAQAPRLLLDRPFAPAEMLFEARERDAFIRVHAHQISDFLLVPALVSHGPPLVAEIY